MARLSALPDHASSAVRQATRRRLRSATNNVPDEAPSVSFHAALGLDAAAFADVQARVRTCVLPTFVRRGLIDKDDATEIRAWAHDGGF